MKKISLIAVIGIFLVTFTSCDLLSSLGNSNMGEITLNPSGNRILSEIAIRMVDRVEGGSIYFKEGNYATETSIQSSTSFEVDPGQYYVYFRYQNLSTLSSGWWQTTSDNLIDVAAGEKWTVDYGYSGGSISQD